MKVNNTRMKNKECPDCTTETACSLHADCRVCNDLRVVYDITCRKYVPCPKCRRRTVDRPFVVDLQRLCDLAEDLSSRAEGIGTLSCLCRLLMALSQEIKGSYLRNLEERQ